MIAVLIRIAYRGYSSIEVKTGHPKRERNIVKVFTKVTSAIDLLTGLGSLWLLLLNAIIPQVNGT